MHLFTKVYSNQFLNQTNNLKLFRVVPFKAEAFHQGDFSRQVGIAVLAFGINFFISIKKCLRRSLLLNFLGWEKIIEIATCSIILITRFKEFSRNNF